MRDIKDRFSELCIDKSLTFTSRATSPFSRGGKGVGDFRGIVRFFERLLSCSCNDVLTKLLMLCRYGKCFRRCWRYISLYCFNNRFFDRVKSDRVFLSDLFLYAFKIPFGSILEGSTFFILRVAVKAKLSGVIGNRVIFKSGKFS